MRWLRLYDDTINDPKIIKLPEATRWHWIAMLCIASKNDGALPALDDVAIQLRVTAAKATEIISALVKAQLLDKTETGFAPHNWNGRQYKSDVSTDRVKRFRNGLRNVSPTVTATVSETPPETEADTEADMLPSVALRAVDREASKARKRARTLPDGWQPSIKSYQIAEQHGQNVQIVEQIFRDYLASSGKLYADHDAAFHNFIRNQNSFNRGGSNGVRQHETRGSIVNAADRAIARLEREIAADSEGGPYALLGVSEERLR